MGLGTPPWDPWVLPRHLRLRHSNENLLESQKRIFCCPKPRFFHQIPFFAMKIHEQKYWQYQNFTLNPNPASELRFKPPRDQFFFRSELIPWGPGLVSRAPGPKVKALGPWVMAFRFWIMVSWNHYLWIKGQSASPHMFIPPLRKHDLESF